jgi:hypothetical protein
MTPTEREFALKGLDDSRERLVGIVRGLSREQLAYRSDPDRWSIAENLEHIILVEKFVLGALRGPANQATGLSRQSRWEGRDQLFMKKLAEDRVERFEAPERFRPSGRWPAETVVAEFDAARVFSREFAASTPADLRSRFFLHPAPAIGEIDGYQLLLLIGAHCDRHCKQSDEVKAFPLFPRQSD